MTSVVVDTDARILVFKRYSLSDKYLCVTMGKSVVLSFISSLSLNYGRRVLPGAPLCSTL